MPVRINYLKLEECFANFKAFILQKNVNKTLSFSEGYLDEQERYKERLHEEARTRMLVESWDKAKIGSGIILDLVIKSIEINEKEVSNNLVNWTLRRGAEARDHHSLYEAQKDTNSLRNIEQALFNFYKNVITDESAFNKLIELVGKRYALIAYFFFLKNKRKYLPIAPNNFDEIFEILGIGLRTSHKCSWDNYSAYCDVIGQVQEFLRENIDEDLSLLDAHSFLWVLGHQMKRELKASISTASHVISVTPLVLKRLEPKSEHAVVRKSKQKMVFDLEKNQKQHREFCRRGDMAEMYVIEAEKRILEKGGRIDLAERVEKISNKDSCAGYDILSYTLTGEEKHIEVKSTIGDTDHNQFYISRNELFQATQDECYYLYIVYDIEGEPQIKYLFRPNFEDAELFDFEPLQYSVKYRAEINGNSQK